MKPNAINISLLALIFAVLACGCPGRLKELSEKQPSPTPQTSNDPPRPIAPTPIAKKGEYELSYAKYDRIKVGSKRSDVEAILGGEGTEISSSTGGGMSFSVNKWEGDGYRSIIISFRNDKVMTKSQVGLK